MANTPDFAPPPDPSADLDSMNMWLAAWAAASAEESPSLIERFEAMGYEVRGKSRDEVAEVLRHPPTRAPRP
ncbi:hypothetical protein [Methylobacterium nodulans]|uniref:Uncharacterized protein n=1 Tax=Methylobacterium nodulans (strain LMG 21967 / CNCM I-2342 / ORS 2060) TaxID=460265 RepID=B8IQ76_METNO|nr:hypothetical protein [Methylobacterium nodulans]ACL58576.1 conserved hypothetical protein [Methylobacterium nodulans ORS 2060]